MQKKSRNMEIAEYFEATIGNFSDDVNWYQLDIVRGYGCA